MRCKHWDKLNTCFWCGRDISRPKGQLPPICDYVSDPEKVVKRGKKHDKLGRPTISHSNGNQGKVR